MLDLSRPSLEIHLPSTKLIDAFVAIANFLLLHNVPTTIVVKFRRLLGVEVCSSAFNSSTFHSSFHTHQFAFAVLQFLLLAFRVLSITLSCSLLVLHFQVFLSCLTFLQFKIFQLTPSSTREQLPTVLTFTSKNGLLF